MQIRDLGFAGVQNFPTVGLIDGVFRQNLEETGMGYDREVEMIRLAHELDLLTTPYVFNPDEAARMAEAGADILVAHMGLTTAGTIGAKTAKIARYVCGGDQRDRRKRRRVRDNVLLLCHGGPIAEPDDAAFILNRCPQLHGFYGASSMERLPTERAIKEQTQRFLKLRRR